MENCPRINHRGGQTTNWLYWMEAHNLMLDLSWWALGKIVGLAREKKNKKMGPKKRGKIPYINLVAKHLPVLCCPCFAGFTNLWVSPWPGYLHPGCASVFPSGFSPRQGAVQCSGVKCGRTFEICLSLFTGALQEEAWTFHFHYHVPAVLLAPHCKWWYCFMVAIFLTISDGCNISILWSKLDACQIAVNEQQKPGWPFWSQAGPTWPLVYGLQITVNM